MKKREKHLIIAASVTVVLSLAVWIFFFSPLSASIFGSSQTSEAENTQASETDGNQPSDGSSNNASDDPDSSGASGTVVGDITIFDYRVNAQGGVVSQPIKHLEIVNASDRYTLVDRGDKTMVVKAYEDLPSDYMAVQSLCSMITNLHAVKKLEPVDDVAQFGLNAPRATAVVTFHDDTKRTIKIGDPSIGTEGYYACVDGDDNVYIVDTSVGESLLAEGKTLVGKTLISPPSLKAGDDQGQAQLLNLWLTGRCREVPVEIAVDVNGEHLGLTYVSPYVMKAPYLRAVDSDTFHVTASTMTSLTAARVEVPHPTAEQLIEYGLSDPYSTAAFTLAVVSTQQGDNGATTSTHYNDREHMILLGNKDEDGNYYALVDGYDVIYALSPSSVPWAESTHFDLMSKLLFMKAITSVEEIAILHEGTETVFSLEHRPTAETRDEQLIVRSNGKMYKTSDFRTLYQMMIGIKRVAEKDDGATASGQPTLQFKMRFNDGSAPMTVSMYPMTASRYLCVTDDGEQTAVSIRDAETFLLQYANYLKGETVYSPY